MTLTFVNSSLFNLDNFLLNPQYRELYPDVDPIQQYKETYYKMCHSKPVVILRNNKISINNLNINCTFTVNNLSVISNVINSKWCIIRDEGDVYPNTLFFVCKITNITRTDVKSFRMTCDIDPIRSFPMNNRVYRLFDEYNGDEYNTDMNYPLDYPIFSHNGYQLSNMGSTSYIVCAVFLNDPQFNKYKFDRIQGIDQLDNVSGIYSSTFVCAFGLPQFVEYIDVPNTYPDSTFEGSTRYINATTTQLNNMFPTSLTLNDSLNSFKEYYNKINTLGTGSTSPISNIIGCFIVPREAIDNLDNQYLTSFSKSMEEDNGIILPQELLINNVLCSELYSYDRDKLQAEQANKNFYSAYGKFITLKPFNLGMSGIYIQNQVYNEYYDLPLINDLINVEISTNDSRVNVPMNIYKDKSLWCVPYFTGSKIEYYCTFNKDISNTFEEYLSNYRITGKFIEIPLISNGITRFDTNEGTANRIKMVASAFNNIPLLPPNPSKNISEQRRFGVGITNQFTGMVNFGSDAAQIGIANKAGISAPNTIEEFPSSISPLLNGLFRVQCTVVRPEVLSLIKDELNYYGYKSNNNYSLVNLTNASSYYSIKYHKSVGGAFSSPELETIFNNGVFVVIIDLSNTDNAVETIRKINELGVSTDV